MLTLGSKLRRRLTLHEQTQIIPLRADHCLAQAFFIRPHTIELRRKISLASRRVLDHQGFIPPADGALALLRPRRESPDDLLPHLVQKAAGANQRLGVRCQLLWPWVRRFQECITRAQRALIDAQGRPVTRFYLRSDEIEVTPSQLSWTTDQFEIVICK